MQRKTQFMRSRKACVEEWAGIERNRGRKKNEKADWKTKLKVKKIWEMSSVEQMDGRKEGF